MRERAFKATERDCCVVWPRSYREKSGAQNCFTLPLWEGTVGE